MIDVLEHPEAQAIDAMDEERKLHEHINSLLARWHSWSAGHGYGMGYPTTNAACRMTRASRQYDDANGGLDAQIDNVLMEAVDAVVNAIAQPWCTALQIQARNLHTGRAVWLSPRLPVCPRLRGQVLATARTKFLDGLAKAGML